MFVKAQVFMSSISEFCFYIFNTWAKQENCGVLGQTQGDGDHSKHMQAHRKHIGTVAFQA